MKDFHARAFALLADLLAEADSRSGTMECSGHAEECLELLDASVGPDLSAEALIAAARLGKMAEAIKAGDRP
jgi:hypothetical protein